MRRADRQLFTDAVLAGDLVDWVSAYYPYDRLWIYLGKQERDQQVIMMRVVKPIIREMKFGAVNRVCRIIGKGEQ